MISRFLVSLTGADYQLLVKVREVRKYAGMGGAVLMTGVLAAVSAGFALRTAVDAPLWLALMLGGVWGIAILNLDSWIVASNKRLATWWKTVGAAVPRLLLAVVLGVVISEPLVLQVFKTEIDAELTVMRAEDQGAFDERLTEDPRYQRLAREKQEARRIQDEVAAGMPATAVTDDPDVKQAQATYDRLDAQLQQAQARTSCEGRGTCGTGQAGAGRIFQTNLDTQRRLEGQVGQAQVALDEARAEARREALDQTRARARAAEVRLAELEASIADAERQRQHEIEEHRAEVRASDGLLARMRALGRVADDEPELAFARWFLFVFLLVIECTPVLVKLLSNLMPPSDYERYFTVEQEQLLTQRGLESRAALDRIGLQLWDQHREVQSAIDAADLDRTAPLDARRQAEEAELLQAAVLQRSALDAAQLQAVIDLESVRVQAEASAQEQREPALQASYRLWSRMEQRRQEAQRAVDAEAVRTEAARTEARASAASQHKAESFARDAQLAVHQKKVQTWVRAQDPLIEREVQQLLDEGRREAQARAAEAAGGQAQAEHEVA